RRQPVDDSAFHLRGYSVRIERAAAIDRAGHAAHAHGAGLDLHLGDPRGDRVERFGEREAAPAVCALQRSAPGGSARRRLEHAPMARRALEAREPVLQWILARRVRRLVEERLDEESIVAVPDAAPE